MPESQDLSAQAGDYYRRKLAEHGPGAAGMDWRDRASQHLRFEVIARYLDWTAPPRVLDVGCGDGEFLAYCRARGLELDYSGIDVCPEMVATCCDRFGGPIAAVGTTAGLGAESYDFVIASGTFNVRQLTPEATWREYVHRSIREMFAAAKRGIVLNLMTTHVDYRYDHLYYAGAEELDLLAVESLSRHFVIDHSYPLYEQTFAAWRKPWRP